MANNRASLPDKRQWGMLITILLMYFFAPTFSSVVSTFSLMPEHYGISPATVSWISSLANPTACVAGLVIGSFAGRRLSYRTCAFLAMLLFSVFGALPFLWRTIPFGILLVSRALFGLGVGCINPLVQAILTRMFTSETARAVWIGVATIIFSIGASVGRVVAGALALDGSWQNAYAFYLLALIPMVMVLFFVRDELLQGGSAQSADKTDGADASPAQPSATERRRIPGIAWAFIIVFLFSTLISSTFFNYAPIAMADSGCNTLLIGTVMAMFTVTGIFVAAANAPLWKVLRLWNLPLAFLLLTISYGLCLLGYLHGSTAFFFAGSIVMGAGCCLAGMVMPMTMSTVCSAASLTLAIGLQEVARNFGSFLSSPWLQAVGGIFGDTSVAQFTAVMVLSAAVTVAAVFVALRGKRHFDVKSGR